MNLTTNRRGRKLDQGRITIEENRDRVWRGRQRDGNDVLVAFKSMRYSSDTDALFRYDAPGIAKFVYFGDAGGGEVALAEELPAGTALSEAPRLDERQSIQLGIDLCSMAIGWGERREYLHIGVRPETVYLLKGQFSGTTPRTECLLGREYGYFEAPADSFGTYKPDDIGFLAARLMWIALLGEDPYKFPGHLNDNENIWNDRRRPWTGPPALGRLLEQVLVVDNRLPVARFRDALLELQNASSSCDPL